MKKWREKKGKENERREEGGEIAKEEVRRREKEVE